MAELPGLHTALLLQLQGCATQATYSVCTHPRTHMHIHVRTHAHPCTHRWKLRLPAPCLLPSTGPLQVLPASDKPHATPHPQPPRVGKGAPPTSAGKGLGWQPPARPVGTGEAQPRNRRDSLTSRPHGLPSALLPPRAPAPTRHWKQERTVSRDVQQKPYKGDTLSEAGRGGGGVEGEGREERAA